MFEVFELFAHFRRDNIDVMNLVCQTDFFFRTDLIFDDVLFQIIQFTLMIFKNIKLSLSITVFHSWGWIDIYGLFFLNLL
jgi:hypothetical protein